MAALKWGEIGRLDREKGIEHTCFCQANDVAVMTQLGWLTSLVAL